VHVLDHELPRAEAGNEAVHFPAGRSAAGGQLHPVHEPVLVALGLQLAYEPGTGVGHGLVVHVHRVLSGQQDTQAERPGLLEQHHERCLGGRIEGIWRNVPGDLVEVQQRPQRVRALLAAHPGHQFVEHGGHHEHPLLVVEMGQVDDVAGSPPGVLTQHGGDVQGCAGPPELEIGRGQDAVQGHGQFPALRSGEELLQRENAQLLDGRGKHGAEQRFQGDRLAPAPVVLEDVAQEDVFRALQRVRLNPDQPQQGADGAAHAVQPDFRVVPVGRVRTQHAENVEGNARGRTGRVDANLGLILELGHPGGRHVPGGQAVPPLFRRGRGHLLDRLAFAAGDGRRNPGRQVPVGQFRKVEAQVGQISLGVQHQHGNTRQQHLLEHDQGEPGLAAAGHADDQAVGGEIVLVIGPRLQNIAARLVQPAAELQPFRGHSDSPPTHPKMTASIQDFHPAENKIPSTLCLARSAEDSIIAAC